MPRKTKIEKIIEAATEKPEIHTFQPYTWIKCIHESMWSEQLLLNKNYLFIGWITNADIYGDNAVLFDDRGMFTCSIKEEDFEVLK